MKELVVGSRGSKLALTQTNWVIEERKKEIENVRSIVDDEVRKFMAWTRSLEVMPVIRLLREKVDSIREGEWERTRGRLNLSEKDEQTVQAMMQALVNKIMHDPILRIRDYAASSVDHEKLDTVRELFGLDIEEGEGEQAPAPMPESEAPTGK